MGESAPGAQRRAAVVCRHPATLRQLAQSLGVAGLTMRQALGPSFLPRSQRGEFEVVLLDLDIDPDAAPQALVDAVVAACPETPIVVVAGVNARQRLVSALGAREVAAIVPKVGTWLDVPTSGPPSAEGADEQDLGVALRRLIGPATIPVGPLPYLLGGTVIEERVVGSSAEKDEALAELTRHAERFSFGDEKLRRIETVSDELLMNAVYDAPRDEQGQPRFATLDRRTPVTLGAQAQVRLRWGCDARSFVVSVSDRFGALGRPVLVQHIARVLESRGPRPRTGAGGAGLGLVLCFTTANQLIVHGAPGRFTEVTAVLYVAGSNRIAMARGSSLQIFL